MLEKVELLSMLPFKVCCPGSVITKPETYKNPRWKEGPRLLPSMELRGFIADSCGSIKQQTAPADHRLILLLSTIYFPQKRDFEGVLSLRQASHNSSVFYIRMQRNSRVCSLLQKTQIFNIVKQTEKFGDLI